MAHLQYDRPDLDQRKYLPMLYVSGSFAIAKPREAYEGRIPIFNSVGDCQVQQIEGDRLPNGSQLYIDQATKQVVISWPAYGESSAPISNPGFEQGDIGWVKGAGWKIDQINPPVGSWAGDYMDNRGESVMSNAARYTVTTGQVTNAKCKVRQGASSEGNAGAAVLLEYRDGQGNVVMTREGNRVMSASNNRVYDSNVIGVAPFNAQSINIAALGIRDRENKRLHVDQFEWDHTVVAAGVAIETRYNLTLLVSDSTGRSYIWTGAVVVVSSILLAATGVGAGMIWRCLDGVTWERVNTGMDFEIYRVDICGSRIYASGLRASCVSFDGGGKFTRCTGGSMGSFDIVGVAEDETTKVVVIISDSNDFVRSTDGVNFVTAGFFAGTKYFLFGDPGRLFCGSTNNTLKISTDGSLTWATEDNNLPLSNGSYTPVNCMIRYELGYLAVGSSDKHIFRSETGNPSAWTLGANIARNGGGTVTIGAIGLEIMIAYSNAYRFSQDGGLTMGAEIPMENGLTIGAPQGGNRIVSREDRYYTSADTGVMRYTRNVGWELVLNERSPTGRRPCVAILK